MSFAASASVRAMTRVEHAHHVGGEPRGDEVADVRGGRDQHLAAHVAALLLRGELVLEMHARRARLDERLHDLEGVERAAEAGFRIGDDGREPGLDRAAALQVFDLVGALQGAVDAADQLRPGIRRIERLVRIHGAGRIGVGGDLPAGEVDRLQPGADHLHGLVAGERAERVDEILLRQQLPQPLGGMLGERMADRDRAAQARHFGCRIGPLDAVEAARRRARHKILECRHHSLRFMLDAV